MNKIMNVYFHINKIMLVYKIPEDFMTQVISATITPESKKLNDFMHRYDCTVKHIYTKLANTEKGNQMHCPTKRTFYKMKFLK